MEDTQTEPYDPGIGDIMKRIEGAIADDDREAFIHLYRLGGYRVQREFFSLLRSACRHDAISIFEWLYPHGMRHLKGMHALQLLDDTLHSDSAKIYSWMLDVNLMNRLTMDERTHSVTYTNEKCLNVLVGRYSEIFIGKGNVTHRLLAIDIPKLIPMFCQLNDAPLDPHILFAQSLRFGAFRNAIHLLDLFKGPVSGVEVWWYDLVSCPHVELYEKLIGKEIPIHINVDLFNRVVFEAPEVAPYVFAHLLPPDAKMILKFIDNFLEQSPPVDIRLLIPSLLKFGFKKVEEKVLEIRCWKGILEPGMISALPKKRALDVITHAVHPRETIDEAIDAHGMEIGELKRIVGNNIRIGNLAAVEHFAFSDDMLETTIKSVCRTPSERTIPILDEYANTDMIIQLYPLITPTLGNHPKLLEYFLQRAEPPAPGHMLEVWFTSVTTDPQCIDILHKLGYRLSNPKKTARALIAKNSPKLQHLYRRIAYGYNFDWEMMLHHANNTKNVMIKFIIRNRGLSLGKDLSNEPAFENMHTIESTKNPGQFQNLILLYFFVQWVRAKCITGMIKVWV